jgi:hypothetical protein
LFYSYRAFGLHIRSPIALPQLSEESESAPDVCIRFGQVEEIPLRRSSFGIWAGGDSTVLQVFHEEVGRFSVRAGSEIVMAPAASAEECVIQRWIAEGALTLVLHQRGYLLFHGSAVALKDGVAVFLGGPHFGKSTLAAALHQLGHDVLADDCIVIADSSEHPLVVPSSSELKLWPDAATSLGHDVEKMPRVHPRFEKRIHTIRREPRSALPLRCLYVLSRAETAEILPLTRREGIMELVRHSAWAELFHVVNAGPQFLRCARLAQVVPIRRLQRPWSLSVVPAIAQMIEDDLTQHP